MKDKIFKAGLIVFPLTLPLPIALKFSSIAMILFILTCLVNYDKHFRFNLINKNIKWILLSFIAYFFVDGLTGLLFRSEFKIYEVKLLFFILPIVFIVSSCYVSKNKEIIFKSFIIGQFLYFIYAILYMVYFYRYLTETSFAFNGYFRYALYNHLPGAVHHTYLGLNIFLCIVFLEECQLIKNKYLRLATILIFIAFSMALGAKIINLALIIYIIYKFFKKTNKLLYILSIFVLALSLLNYKTVIKKLESSYSTRIEIWECAKNVISENIITGVGKSNVKMLIYNCNRSIGYNEAHNLWLQEWMSNGILGLALLLFLFITILRVDTSNKALMFFVGIVLFSGLTEHIFTLQRGVMFFVFFTLVFLTRYFKTVVKS